MRCTYFWNSLTLALSICLCFPGDCYCPVIVYMLFDPEYQKKTGLSILLSDVSQPVVTDDGVIQTSGWKLQFGAKNN